MTRRISQQSVHFPVTMLRAEGPFKKKRRTNYLNGSLFILFLCTTASFPETQRHRVRPATSCFSEPGSGYGPSSPPSVLGYWVKPRGTRLGIRKDAKGAVRRPKILVLIICYPVGTMRVVRVPRGARRSGEARRGPKMQRGREMPGGRCVLGAARGRGVCSGFSPSRLAPATELDTG